jgi:hypothetical protein
MPVFGSSAARFMIRPPARVFLILIEKPRPRNELICQDKPVAQSSPPHLKIGKGGRRLTKNMRGNHACVSSETDPGGTLEAWKGRL